MDYHSQTDQSLIPAKTLAVKMIVKGNTHDREQIWVKEETSKSLTEPQQHPELTGSDVLLNPPTFLINLLTDYTSRRGPQVKSDSTYIAPPQSFSILTNTEVRGYSVLPSC